jgi:hypothetical protein
VRATCTDGCQSAKLKPRIAIRKTSKIERRGQFRFPLRTRTGRLQSASEGNGKLCVVLQHPDSRGEKVYRATDHGLIPSARIAVHPAQLVLAVVAASPGNAATDAYSTAYAVDPPPAHATSCASTAAATAAAAEADPATSGTAETSTSSTSSAAAASSTTTAAAAAPTSGQLYSGLERAGVFFVEDVEGSQAHVRDFFLTEQDWAAHSRIWRRCDGGCLGGRAASKR